MNALVIQQLGLIGEALIAHTAAVSVGQMPELLFSSYARPHVIAVAKSAGRKRR